MDADQKTSKLFFHPAPLNLECKESINTNKSDPLPTEGVLKNVTKSYYKDGEAKTMKMIYRRSNLFLSNMSLLIEVQFISIKFMQVTCIDTFTDTVIDHDSNIDHDIKKIEVIEYK
jgi:hypothetical protein